MGQVPQQRPPKEAFVFAHVSVFLFAAVFAWKYSMSHVSSIRATPPAALHAVKSVYSPSMSSPNASSHFLRNTLSGWKHFLPEGIASHFVSTSVTPQAVFPSAALLAQFAWVASSEPAQTAQSEVAYGGALGHPEGVR